MDLPNEALIGILKYLLPGFVTAGMIRTLTPDPRASAFERVVQALVFTIIVQLIVVAIRFTLVFVGHRVGQVFGVWTENAQLAWSVAVAMGLALVIAYALNHDTFHSLFRRFGVTFQTSYSSEWYGAFSQNNGYVVLHLKGERHLYGWPEEWPNTPGAGHFLIAQAEWLIDNSTRVALPDVERLLIPAADVEFVEFMAPVEDDRLEEVDG